ncbi:MAG: hypothetical protein M1823_000084 [Watsoniomyces obsoletus]|nr:MAG: hypothetical protein M1823_000084 [Watsoniomyces obsoletus]
MVQQYVVFGRQVGSHWLAMATLGTLGGGIALAMGGKKKSKEQGPPINASNAAEEAFIKDFLRNAELEEAKKQKH